MKKITYLVVTAIAVGLAWAFVVLAQPSFAGAIWQIYYNTKTATTKIDARWNEYTFYKMPEITVIKPKNFSFLFDSAWNSARSIKWNYWCSSVINGTYFGRNDDKTFFPAWVWYSFGSFLASPYQPAKDPNLRVLMWSNGSQIQMMDNDSFDFSILLSSTNPRSWYWNAGPWLVRDGRINPDVVADKSHWQRATTRSAILVNPNNDVRFIVSTQAVTLPQFIAFSYGAWLGTGAFQLVNIDWWSSTSLITPYSTFYSWKTLPSFICIY